MPAFSSSKVSSLGDIAIFTHTGEVALKEVLKSISEKEDAGAVGKLEGNALKTYFEAVLPDYDRERVYTSDMKKVIQWYNLLQQNGLLNFDEEETPEEEVKTEE